MIISPNDHQETEKRVNPNHDIDEANFRTLGKKKTSSAACTKGSGGIQLHPGSFLSCLRPGTCVQRKFSSIASFSERKTLRVASWQWKNLSMEPSAIEAGTTFDSPTANSLAKFTAKRGQGAFRSFLLFFSSWVIFWSSRWDDRKYPKKRRRLLVDKDQESFQDGTKIVGLSGFSWSTPLPDAPEGMFFLLFFFFFLQASPKF